MKVFLGLGIDIVETERIRRARDRLSRFPSRICTETELAAIGADPNGESLAGRFAAKEAIAKALGSPLRWHDVEVLPNVQGKPIVHLHGRARELVGEGKVTVSITHARTVAAAVAVWLGEE